MDRAFLEGLGLSVKEAGGVLEARFELSGGAINPLTRQPLLEVQFTIVGDRLLYVGPPELVGAQPINLAFITHSARLEDLVNQTLDEILFQLERRSSELTAIGVNPRVDPQTLQLTADLTREPFRFTIAANRSGQFRIIRAEHGDAEISLAGATNFELSEFRDRSALEDFLYAMFADIGDAPTSEVPAVVPPQEGAPALISYQDLSTAFGEAVVPPRSTVEVLAELEVNGEVIRFAAARVQGRTFRGLLASSSGKLWADRFELREFGGVRELVASVMRVPLATVKLRS